MTAYEIPNLRFSGESGAAIARRRFVKFNSDGKVIQAVAGDINIVGASSQPCTKAGEVAEVYDGIVMVEAGATVAAGAAVQSDADGKAITLAAVSVDTSGASVVVPESKKAGVALTGGAAGELLAVKI